MSSATAISGVALKPIVIPNEHGGWGFLLEPIVLGLLLAPSWRGVLIAIAAIFGFLTRQPLKFAMQDTLRGKWYPRTRVCWITAATYASVAVLAIAFVGWKPLIPFAIVSPLALIALVADARNKSRALVPELAGAVAMTSTAASIAIAAAQPWTFVVLLVARNVSAIVYVRALFKRAHPAWPIVLHAVAIAVAVPFGWFAVAAMSILFVRAIAGLMRDVPRAQTVGWMEMAFGAVSVGLFAI